MNTHNKPRRKKGLVIDEIDADLLVYDPKSDHLHLLNATASTIWELCDGSRASQEIVEEIVKHFSSENHDIKAQVEGALQQLYEKGLIE
jgi:PqqD family protein of HPr-rel-A system